MDTIPPPEDEAILEETGAVQDVNLLNRKKRKLLVGTYQERRAKRIAQMQETYNTSKSRVRDDGVHWLDAHQQFTSGEGIVEDDEANMDVTWEEVSFDSIRESAAKQMLEADQTRLDPELCEKYRQETSSQWNKFYTHNKQNFFKDRNYLGRFFTELAQVEGMDKDLFPKDDCKRVMEVGSGVGNSLFPLMDMNPDKFFYAFDCSTRAIELLKEQERYNTKRAHSFVCDITCEDIPDSDVLPGSIDFITMIFMLSAVPPEHMDDVLQKINRKMKIGGIVLFRDYGLFDMTQMRFYAKKTLNKLGENFYRRGDGTFSYFFSLEALAELFKKNGFDVLHNEFDTRVLSNRKRKIRMYRVWAQSKFVKVRDTPVESSAAASSSNDFHTR